MSRYFPFFSLVLLLVASGCWSRLPADLPRLYPCQIKVTQDGVPLVGAMVTLFADDSETQRWTPVAKTNEQGVAVLHTNLTYPGGPAGEYKVTVLKIELDTSRFGPEPEAGTPENERWMSRVSSANLATLSFVPKDYLHANTTPLTFEIKKKRSNSAEFDVGKPVNFKLY